MKILKSQSWEIIGEDEDDKIDIDFERFKDDVDMHIHYKKTMITLNKEQIVELKNILDSTKFIFNQ